MQTITISLEAFEGPFDLLYHLIEKNEIDIYDIPIAMITEQYLDYLAQVPVKSMDNMSEFLLMAATLLEIKSKFLLPNPKLDQQEQDPREDLVSKLIEYKKFKSIADQLKIRQEEAAFVFFKEADERIKLYISQEETGFEDLLQGITLQDIYFAFEDVIKRKELKVDRVRSSFKSVERDLYTIEEKIEYIKDLLFIHSKVKFHEIFRAGSRKMEVVVTFLALLELMKQKLILVTQETAFHEIVIKNYEREKNEIN